LQQPAVINSIKSFKIVLKLITMATPTASLKAQFDLHTRLFNNATEGITEGDAHARNHDKINHIKWIAGHLLNTRINSLTKLTGGQPDDTYAAQFGRGVALDPGATYPPIEEITAKWKATAGAISNGISNIPEDVLAAKSPTQAPIADDTIRGLLSFLISHEAYHIGQLGMLRKMAGKEAMSYQ
jgi:DinB family protein